MTLSDVDRTKMLKGPKRVGRNVNGRKKWPKKTANYKKNEYLQVINMAS